VIARPGRLGAARSCPWGPNSPSGSSRGPTSPALLSYCPPRHGSLPLLWIYNPRSSTTFHSRVICLLGYIKKHKNLGCFIGELPRQCEHVAGHSLQNLRIEGVHSVAGLGTIRMRPAAHDGNGWHARLFEWHIIAAWTI